jgi:hypothetical protein
MSARRIAVLMGSHDPAYFARHTQPDRPSEPTVLAALRAQRSTSEASHRASATQTLTDHGGSIARHADASDAGTRRAHVPDSGGPPRISVFAAAARTRRPTRHTRARVLTSRTAGA